MMLLIIFIQKYLLHFSQKTKNKNNARRMIRKINNSYNSINSSQNRRNDFQKMFRIAKGFKNNSTLDKWTGKINSSKGNTATDIEDFFR